MSGSATGLPAGDSRFARRAGMAGLATPILWAIATAIEVAHANIGHSIISRPERFFSTSDWH